MKTTIKIHDTEWFKEHCRICDRVREFDGFILRPKYDSWLYVRTIHWLQGPGCMDPLEGKVLEVEHDSGFDNGSISNARYMAGGYWIPNWAIEWVKEEQDAQCE
jgi:hypothetical protein